MGTEVETVTILLAAAGLAVPQGEIERLAQLYPGLRRSVDRLYEIDTADEVPAAIFRAAEISPLGAQQNGATS
jgi:hypothetical protein